jgi:tetratricopeptide (TPR) repeat protein
MKKLSSKQIIDISNSIQSARHSIQLGQFDLAEKYFLNALKIKPDFAEARASLAFIYTSKNEHVKASQELKLLLKTNVNLAQTHYNLGNSLYEQALYDEAITHYKASIKIQPNNTDCLINCGIAFRMLRNYDNAIEQVQAALNLDKKNVRAFHVLGSIFADIQDFPRALECFENAVGLAPQQPQFLVSFAETLKKAGLDYEAGIELHRVCEKNPNYADGFIGYGEYLIDHHRFDEALECYEQAKILNPDNINILERLGEAYAGLSNTEMALAEYNLALKSEPNRTSSLIGKANVYIDLGKSEEVLNISKQLIEFDDKSPNAYLLQSRAKKSTLNDGLAESLLTFINDSKIETESKIAINFSLGKVFDDQNNFHDAFKYYANANSLRNSSLFYSSKDDESRFSKLIQLYSQEFFETHKHLATNLDIPIIIIGMPRSGTTLTEQIISSHPKIIGAGEVAFWTKAPTAMPLRIGSQTEYPNCMLELNTQHAKEIALMYESTLKKIAGFNSDTKHITDKLPHNFLNLGLIALLFPNAKIIHTKRNPIDTCLSIFFQNFNNAHKYAFNLENLGFHYKQYQRIMKHWHKVLPDRIMDINYEDTITDPEYWSRKLIAHIGLEWDDACLAPHKLERTVKTASHWQVRQPIYKTSVERWRNYEEFLGPLIEALKD